MTRPDGHYADSATELCDAIEQKTTARAFEVTLISGSLRIVRNVIAHSAVVATRTALSYMPYTSAPLAVICKPVVKGAINCAPTERIEPCAA